MNVEPAWLQGLTGEGVTVAIVDDGEDFNCDAQHDFVEC